MNNTANFSMIKWKTNMLFNYFLKNNVKCDFDVIQYNQILLCVFFENIFFHYKTNSTSDKIMFGDIMY